MHSYRVRWNLAERDPRYEPMETALAGTPTIEVPTLVIHGAADPCNDPSTSAGKEAYFGSDYRRVLLAGVGHFPQRQSPDAVGSAILEFLRSHAPRPAG